MDSCGCKVSRVVSMLTVVACTTALAPAYAQQKPGKSSLSGAWMLVSIETTSRDGSKRPGFGGPHAKGILVLDASGRYAQVTGRPDRPKLETTVRMDMPTAALGEAARSFGAGFGTWSLDEAGRTIVLKSELSSIPNNDKTERTHSFSVAGDELTLVAAAASGGTTEFVYRRAR